MAKGGICTEFEIWNFFNAWFLEFIWCLMLGIYLVLDAWNLFGIWDLEFVIYPRAFALGSLSLRQISGVIWTGKVSNPYWQRLLA